MNTKLIKLLTIACAVLGGIIVSEWLYASYAQRQMLVSIKSGSATPYQADKLPELNLALQAEENYVDLVTRPLFIQGRRPVDEPEIATKGILVESDSFDWQLDGIYSYKKRISALFSRTKKTGAKYESSKITTGDEIEGWTLSEIGKDSVIMEKDSKRKELMLRKPKLKALPQQKERKPANVPKRNAETPENNDNEK